MTGKKCNAINRKDCYDALTKDRCCATCNVLYASVTGKSPHQETTALFITLRLMRKDVVGCEYGDKGTSCDAIRPRQCYQGPVAEQCCETCPRYRSSEPGCEYGDQLDTCMEDIRSPRDCYDRAPDCCATCSKYKLNVTGMFTTLPVRLKAVPFIELLKTLSWIRLLLRKHIKIDLLEVTNNV